MWKSIALALILFVTTTVASTCKLCEFGNCTTAYKGDPGKWCGHWMSGEVRAPCCCPDNALCASRTASECRCVYPTNYAAVFGVLGLVIIGVWISIRWDTTPSTHRYRRGSNGDFTTGYLVGMCSTTDYGTDSGFAGDC